MISFYDALTFSVQKKSLFAAVCTALIMMSFAALIAVSLEVNFSLFSLFRHWVQAVPQSPAATAALGQIAYVLQDPFFWGIVFRKMLWFCYLFIFFSLAFFSFELIVAKKALFNQPPHFTASFLLIASAKFMLLMTPILGILYVFLYEVLKSAFGFLGGTVIGQNPTYQFPFSLTGTIIVSAIFFIYFLYVMLLFIERFSFHSLLACGAFFKNLKTVLELFLKIILSNLLLLIGWGILLLILWKIDSLYVCFAAFMSYLIWMLVLNRARFILMLPFWAIAGLAIYMRFAFGRAFFDSYLFVFMTGGLTYFCFFFFWYIFWGTLAHLFSASAFVLRFGRTPAKDIKKQSPEKLQRIDQLYDTYLKSHQNDSQDNFFHHLEEKRK